MNTKQQENLETLTREYASTVFGIEYRKDIQNIPEGKSGDYRVIDDINIDENYIFQSIYRNDTLVASNDPRKAYAHRFFLEKANGRILISGLGLGDSLFQVLKNPNVDFVLVIESEPDIINLVAPSFSKHSEAGRVKIINEDIFKYQPTEHFDCIYHAIWNDEKETRAAISDRKKLKERFEPYCDWQGFIYLSPRGGSRKGAGRSVGSTGPYKPKDKTRTIKKGIRYNPKEMELIKQACILSGKTESEIAVNGALKEAIRIIYHIDDSRVGELLKKMAS